MLVIDRIIIVMCIILICIFFYVAVSYAIDTLKECPSEINITAPVKDIWV